MSTSNSAKPRPRPGPWPPGPAAPPSSWAKKTGFRPKFSGETTASDSGQIVPQPVPDLESGRARPAPAAANGNPVPTKRPEPSGGGTAPKIAAPPAAEANGPVVAAAVHPAQQPSRRPVDALPQTVDEDGFVPRQTHMKYELRDAPGLVPIGFYGLQHYMSMLGSLVLIPLIIVPAMGGSYEDTANVVSTVLFVSGLTTLLHTTFGSRLPLIQGPSFVYLAPALVIINSPEFLGLNGNNFKHIMKQLQGAVIISSAFQTILGYSGLMTLFVRLINPVVVAPTIAAVGLSFYSYGFPRVGTCIEIGAVQILLVIIFSLYLRKISVFGHRVFLIYAVPLGLGITWAIAFLLTEAGAYNYKGCDVNVPPSNIISEHCRKHISRMKQCRVDTSHALNASPWFRFQYPLQWGTPVFNWKMALVMCVLSLISSVDSVGSYHASSLLESPLYRRLCGPVRQLQPPTPQCQSSRKLRWFFKECPHPDEKMRLQLSKELKFEPQQIKVWFQNKRTQQKIQKERDENDALKLENKKLQNENIAIEKALINARCPACHCFPLSDERHLSIVQKLRTENVHLKRELERLSKTIPNIPGKPIPETLLLSDTIPNIVGNPILGTQSLLPSLKVPTEGFNPCLDPKWGYSGTSNSLYLTRDAEKSMMVESAFKAMEELIKVLQLNEPLTFEFSISARYGPHHDNNYKTFARPNHLKSSTTRVELSNTQNKWVDLFPTIVTNARMIEVLDSRTLGDQAGSMQLMYEKMHVLSPLVAPREFYFLRYCRQVGSDLFVMVDVSYNHSSRNQETADILCWRWPSGCLIRGLSGRYSQVTWVEHVEVNDESPTHYLYRELVHDGSAYGAKRWIHSLKRMIERLKISIGSTAPNHVVEGAINLSKGKRSIMGLAHRMVRSFCKHLNMSEKLDSRHISNIPNDGFRVSICQNNMPGLPIGMIVGDSSSFWLPV